MSDTALGTPPADVAPALERPTLGQILRHYGAAFRRQFAGRLSREQLRVMDLLERCRTGELGAVLYRCQACGTTHVQPQSCGNRHCPRCQGHKAQQWLEQQLARRLPCAYFLITFTVPQALRPFIRGQPREAYRAMFAAALATLRKLAQNPRHVGSRRVGGTGVLHTWGRTLCYHGIVPK